MSPNRYTTSEIVRRGQERYERDIRAQVEVHHGKMLALDVDSGQYSLADDSITALDRLKLQVPEAAVFLLRIGFPTAVRLGGANRASRP